MHSECHPGLIAGRDRRSALLMMRLSSRFLSGQCVKLFFIVPAGVMAAESV